MLGKNNIKYSDGGNDDDAAGGNNTEISLRYVIKVWNRKKTIIHNGKKNISHRMTLLVHSHMHIHDHHLYSLTLNTNIKLLKSSSS